MTPLFYLNVAVLALLLFFPASKLIWVLSVRRMERKLGRSLESVEIDGQRTRARFISLFLVIIFSWLFNLQLAATAHG
jgi:hypothetical protein